MCPCVAYKQAKTSNKRAECCCSSSVHVNKDTLFTILLSDISDDNKHLAFEVTTKKNNNKKQKNKNGQWPLSHTNNID